MEYRSLGNTGLMLSVLSYGSWETFKTKFEVPAAKELMALAYENGVNFFDNAETYADGAAEEIMGQALSQLGFDRSTYCVSSKVFWGGKRPTQLGLSRKHVVEACHAALKRLRVDYLDLYFCHRPDPDTPIIETVRAMDTLVKQGKILYWGTSEWEADQITEACLLADKHNLTPPSMEQPQYNMFEREKVEKSFLSLYSKFGIGTTTWSPLCSGLLTGKYNYGVPSDSRLSLEHLQWLKDHFMNDERNLLEKAKKLGKIADDLGIPFAQLSIAWVLKNKNVSTVILGASNTNQLTENLGAIGQLDKITPEVIQKIESVLGNKPTPTPNFKDY